MPEDAVPIEGQTHTVGLAAYKGPFSGNVEYSRSIQNVESSNSWSAGLNYQKDVADMTTLTVVALYAHTAITDAQNVQSVLAPAQTTASITAALSKRFRRGLFVNVGGSYSYLNFQGQTKSQTYNLRSNLRWKVGKLEIALGASISKSTSQTPLHLEQRSLNQHYFLGIRRQIL